MVIPRDQMRTAEGEVHRPMTSIPKFVSAGGQLAAVLPQGTLQGPSQQTLAFAPSLHH